MHLATTLAEGLAALKHELAERDLMKCLLIILLGLFFVGCGETRRETTGVVTSASPSQSEQPDLAREARTEFQQLWYDTTTECNDDTFVAETRNGFIKQFKSVIFTAEPEPITEADKLNNIQWKGIVRAKWAAERTRSSGWGDWQTAYGSAFMYFQKRESTWSRPNMSVWEYKPASCP